MTAIDLAGIREIQGGRPVVPSAGALRPLGIGEVHITGGFWATRLELNRRVMIPHAEEWVERMGWAANFDAAIQGRLPEARRGPVFADSDVYKLIEAMAWEIGRSGDTQMDDRLRRLVDRIAPVQEPDGYLNTAFGRPGQPGRYTDLERGHELYCYGHLIQAAIARARTGGDDLLVQVALCAADHVCDVFRPGGIESVCGHPEIEVALAELARLTGDRKYLDQAQCFIDRRGHGTLGPIAFGADYFQDAEPIRTSRTLTGHSVRALYLAAGAIDVATETADSELRDAVTSQVHAAIASRTYVTGGMGAHHEGESFGLDYELPSDRAYAETCAGVASVMVNYRLLLATGDLRYGDMVERTLYNVVAASPAEDGRAFFYTNTLHQRVPGSPPSLTEANSRAAASLRAPWFEVSCCPTNVARTLASLGAYLASSDEEGIQLHQYATSEIRTVMHSAPLELRVDADYPTDGVIRITVLDSPGERWTLTLRIPAWAAGAVVRDRGADLKAEPGAFELRREFAPGDVIELRLPMTARWTWPDPRVDDLRGQVAIERGPVVYCLESVDLPSGGEVNDVWVHTETGPADDGGNVSVPIGYLRRPIPAWPYGSSATDSSDEGATPVRLLPYAQWANRGPSTMRVWIPVAVGRAEG